MSFVDDTPPDPSHDALDQLRHDLKSPLTTIFGRSQLLARTIQRLPTLTEEERVTMLAGLTTIAVAVQEMVTLIDDMGHGGGDDGGASR